MKYYPEAVVIPVAAELAELRSEMSMLEDSLDPEEFLSIVIDALVNSNYPPLVQEAVDHFTHKHQPQEQVLMRPWFVRFAEIVEETVECMHLRTPAGEFPYYIDSIVGGLVYMRRNPYLCDNRPAHTTLE